MATCPSSLEAGRELDALIAEKVFGWSERVEVIRGNAYKKAEEREWFTAFHERPKSSIYSDMGDFSRFTGRNGQGFSCGKPRKIHVPPNYSTDITAAWQVVEAMKDRPGETADHLGFGIDSHTIADGTRGYSAAIGRYGATAPTAPLAICRAALRALEGGEG
jgi:hypothetical protein